MFEVRIPCGLELEFSSRHRSESDLRGAFLEALGNSLSDYEEPDVWTFKHDCSCGYEVTTPILRTSEELEAACAVFRAVQHRFRGQRLVNRSCGFHVHFSVDDMTRRQCLFVQTAFVKLEGAIYKILPPSRRNGGYCSSLRESANPRGLELITYHSVAVNFMRWNFPGDLEVRYGAGTCDHRKIKHWTLFLQELICRAVDNGPPEEEIDTVEDMLRWVCDGETTEAGKTAEWVLEREQEILRSDQRRR